MGVCACCSNVRSRPEADIGAGKHCLKGHSLKKLLFVMMVALLTGSAIAAPASQIDEQSLAKAKALAVAKGMNLAEYKQPRVSRMDDGSWFLFFEHAQRYHDNQPIYMVDDCFTVSVDGATKEASFHVCP